MISKCFGLANNAMIKKLTLLLLLCVATVNAQPATQNVPEIVRGAASPSGAPPRGARLYINTSTNRITHVANTAGTAWIAVTTNVSVTDNANGTVAIDGGVGNAESAVRPLSELSAVSAALSSTDKILVYNGSIHKTTTVGYLPDFFRQSGSLPSGAATDPTDNIGRIGSVGIGIYNPNAKLHVNGSSAYAKFTNTPTSSTSTDGFDVGIDASGNAELRQRENLGLKVFTNNTERIDVTASGNIKMQGGVFERVPVAAQDVTQSFYIGQIQSHFYGGYKNIITFPNMVTSGDKHLSMSFSGALSGSIPITIAGTDAVAYNQFSLTSARGYISQVLVGLNASGKLQISIDSATITDNQGSFGTPFTVSISGAGFAQSEFEGATVNWTTGSPTWTGSPNTLSNREVVYNLDVRGTPFANQSGFTLLSDERTKTIFDIEDAAAICIVKRTRPIIYEYNGLLGSQKGIKGASYSAQQVETAFDECASLFPKSSSALAVAKSLSIIKVDFVVKAGTLTAYNPLQINSKLSIVKELERIADDKEENSETIKVYRLNIDPINTIEKIALRTLFK